MVNLPSVNFQFDSAELTSDGRGRVDQIASIVKREAANRRVAVEGHASRESAAQEAYNQRLSERRADTVADALARDGVRNNQISSRGLGTRRRLQATITKRVDGKIVGRGNYRELEVPNRGSVPDSKR